MWDGTCKVVNIMCTIESMQNTQLRCGYCTQLHFSLHTQLMHVANCAVLNVHD